MSVSALEVSNLSQPGSSQPISLELPQVIYCLNCCVLAKRAQDEGKGDDFPGVLPAVTFEIQTFNNMPVSVPICGMHLGTGSGPRLELAR